MKVKADIFHSPESAHAILRIALLPDDPFKEKTEFVKIFMPYGMERDFMNEIMIAFSEYRPMKETP